MTNKEVIDKVRTHLLKQNEKALDENDDCVYRGPDNLKCAIGCLIPDDKYSTDFEGQGIILLDEDNVAIMSQADLKVQKDLLEAAGLTESQRELAAQLQRVHDAFEPHQWKAELDKLEAQYA